MNTKAFFYITLFLSIILLLLPVVFFLTVAGGGIAQFPVDLPGKQSILLDKEQDAENRQVEMVNYYSLIYSANKDLSIRPAEKTSPETGSLTSTLNKVTQFSSNQAAILSKEQQMVNYINQARREAGLSALQVNSQMTMVARAKSKDMAVNRYFSHTSPTYGSFTDLLKHYGITYRIAGENLAWNTSGSVSSAHNNLMNSPGHRRNILGPDFRYVGVGVYVGNDGRHYFTQLFVGR